MRVPLCRGDYGARWLQFIYSKEQPLALLGHSSSHQARGAAFVDRTEGGSCQVNPRKRKNSIPLTHSALKGHFRTTPWTALLCSPASAPRIWAHQEPESAKGTSLLRSRPFFTRHPSSPPCSPLKGGTGQQVRGEVFCCSREAVGGASG